MDIILKRIGNKDLPLEKIMQIICQGFFGETVFFAWKTYCKEPLCYSVLGKVTPKKARILEIPFTKNYIAQSSKLKEIIEKLKIIKKPESAIINQATKIKNKIRRNNYESFPILGIFLRQPKIIDVEIAELTDIGAKKLGIFYIVEEATKQIESTDKLIAQTIQLFIEESIHKQNGLENESKSHTTRH